MSALSDLAAREGRECFVAHKGTLPAAFDATPCPGGADFFREHFSYEPGTHAAAKPV